MIEEYDIASHVRLFTARYDGPQSYRDIVLNAWKIEEIERYYSDFLQRFEPEYQKVFERSLNGTLTDNEVFVYRTLLVHEYRKFLFVDPKLPKELLPTYWIGEQADNFFDRYHQFLSPLAEKFFYSNLVVLDAESEGVEAVKTT